DGDRRLAISSRMLLLPGIASARQPSRYFQADEALNHPQQKQIFGPPCGGIWTMKRAPVEVIGAAPMTSPPGNLLAGSRPAFNVMWPSWINCARQRHSELSDTRQSAHVHRYA